MFKKFFVGALSVMSIFGLAACSNETQKVEAMTLSSKESMSLSTYLGASFLQTSSVETVSTRDVRLRRWAESNTLTLESELEEVNAYFDKLKVFMDQGVDNVFNVTETVSTREGYDYEVTYNVDGLTYTIYYSIIVDEVLPPVEETPTDDVVTEDPITDEVVTEDPVTDEVDDDIDEIDDEQLFRINGLIVIDGVEFKLEGAREVEDDEVKTWFKTENFNRSGDYVHVISKVEDNEQKFDIRTSVNGVETRTRIKFEVEDDETKIDLTINNGDNESRYQFKKEVEDGQTFYKFQYRIGDVKGQVKVLETVDVDGNVTYKYQVQENGRNKDITRGGRHHDED